MGAKCPSPLPAPPTDHTGGILRAGGQSLAVPEFGRGEIAAPSLCPLLQRRIGDSTPEPAHAPTPRRRHAPAGGAVSQRASSRDHPPARPDHRPLTSVFETKSVRARPRCVADRRYCFRAVKRACAGASHRQDHRQGARDSTDRHRRRVVGCARSDWVRVLRTCLTFFRLILSWSHRYSKQAELAPVGLKATLVLRQLVG